MLAFAALLQSVSLPFTGLLPAEFAIPLAWKPVSQLTQATHPQQQQPRASCVLCSCWGSAGQLRAAGTVEDRADPCPCSFPSLLFVLCPCHRHGLSSYLCWKHLAPPLHSFTLNYFRLFALAAPLDPSCLGGLRSCIGAACKLRGSAMGLQGTAPVQETLC
jgi:hypothetical protein